MFSLQAFFDEHNTRDIHTLGQYIQAHVDAQWDVVFQAMYDELIELYKKIGDSAYGVYGQRLFQGVHAQFKEVGFKATPKLPGNFMNSREWGESEDDRQRWMWSKITTTDNTPVGTIAIVFWHDHTQIRIPRPFEVIALEETTKVDVVKALSALSADFKAALEARDEFAQYQ